MINQNINSIDNIKWILNNLFTDYIEERIIYKSSQTNSKEKFLEVFNTLSKEDKIIYREYIYNIINPTNFQNSIQEIPLITELRSMDRLEVYAWICNNCKI